VPSELFGLFRGLYIQVDDAGLLERARRGDEQAFSTVFARYKRSIYRYGVYMCGREAADDVVQDTFLAVLRQSGRQDGPTSSLGGYLFGIARHVVMKRLAARGERSFTDQETGVFEDRSSIEPAAFDAIVRAQTVEAVRAAILALPAACREAIVLCELQEMAYANAADVMQVPIGTVRSRLHRARALLARRLSEERTS
jgi:RNA polymerase sigma-70 factor (ECF subfamily)